MPRNWATYQNVNFGTSQVEWPTGPLTFEDYPKPPTPIWIEAWVLQFSTGASQRTTQMAGWAPDLWTADGIPPGWKNGNFQDGQPATGIALLYMLNNSTNTYEYKWWADAIVLY